MKKSSLDKLVRPSMRSESVGRQSADMRLFIILVAITVNTILIALTLWGIISGDRLFGFLGYRPVSVLLVFTVSMSFLVVRILDAREKGQERNESSSEVQ